MSAQEKTVAIIDDFTDSAGIMADWSAVETRARVVTFRNPFGSLDAAVAALGGVDCIVAMRERTPMPRAFFERLPRLSAVSATGQRNRCIDLTAAEDHGVRVMHTGEVGHGAYATPELAWALILAVVRDIPLNDAALRSGGWQTRLGQVLSGRRLGLLGLGRLGSRMVPIAKAFDMEVVAWSPNLTEAHAVEAGAVRIHRDTLFDTADVLSIHMVLVEATRSIVGAGDIARMKPGAILVNTSRAGLVDQAALLAALEAGRIRAGIDVYAQEPLPQDNPFRSAPNTVLTPHVGYCTEDTFRHFYADSVENVLSWLEGAPIRVLEP